MRNLLVVIAFLWLKINRGGKYGQAYTVLTRQTPMQLNSSEIDHKSIKGFSALRLNT